MTKETMINETEIPEFEFVSGASIYASRREGSKLHLSWQEFVRWQLPYGCWTCDDGREVLFDRNSCPIVSRRPGEAAVLADPHEWVRNIVHWQDFYYGDAPPKRGERKITTAKLAEWGMFDPVMQEIERIGAQRRALLEAAAGWYLSACWPWRCYVLGSKDGNWAAAKSRFAEFRRLLRPTLGPIPVRTWAEIEAAKASKDAQTAQIAHLRAIAANPSGWDARPA